MKKLLLIFLLSGCVENPPNAKQDGSFTEIETPNAFCVYYNLYPMHLSCFSKTGATK